MSNLLLMGCGGPVTPPQVFATFNPLDKGAEITLSGGNDTATCTVLPTNTAGVRSTSSRSAGQLHWEFTINSAVGGIGTVRPILALANAAQNMANASAGVGTNSIAGYRDNGLGTKTLFNNVNLGSPEQWQTGDVMACEADFGASQYFLQRLGGAGRRGPYSFAGAGLPYFIYAEFAVIGDSVTLNTGATAFAIAPTAGYVAWGA